MIEVRKNIATPVAGSSVEVKVCDATKAKLFYKSPVQKKAGSKTGLLEYYISTVI